MERKKAIQCPHDKTEIKLALAVLPGRQQAQIRLPGGKNVGMLDGTNLPEWKNIHPFFQ